MQHLHYTLSFLLCILLILAGTDAFAVPGINHHQEEPRSSPSRNVFPQLTWLRDTVMNRLFGASPKSAKAGLQKVLSRPSNSPLPANLLAKYGGDVVLRFNLSTPAEEKALAEAADTLFLDVWEFTNNWADIHLSEDAVC